MLKAGGKELAEIGPLTGTTIPQLGPFNLSGHLSGSVNSFSLGDLTVIVDQSDFNGRAKVEVRKRPKITLVLESSLLDMMVLLKNLEKEEKEPGPAPGGLESRSRKQHGCNANQLPWKTGDAPSAAPTG